MSAAGQLPKISAHLVAVRHSGDIVVREVRILPPLQCTGCLSTRVVRDDQHADLYCDNCGLVLADPGCAPTSDMGGLTATERAGLIPGKPRLTLLGMPRGGEAMKFGKSAARLRLLQNRANRELQRRQPAMEEIDRICFALELPAVVAEEARANYLEAKRRGACRGFANTVLAAGLIVHTARNRDIGMPVRKVRTVLGLPQSNAAGIFRVLRLLHRVGMRDKMPTAEDYIPRFVRTLQLPGIFSQRALEFVQIFREKSGRTTSSPSVVAGAAIYCVLQNADRWSRDGTVWARPQKQIAALAGCTEVSLRNVMQRTRALGWSLEGGWGATS